MCFVPTGCRTHRTAIRIRKGLMPRITMQKQPDPALRSDMSRGSGENEREGSTPRSVRALGGEGGEFSSNP